MLYYPKVHKLPCSLLCKVRVKSSLNALALVRSVLYAAEGRRGLVPQQIGSPADVLPKRSSDVEQKSILAYIRLNVERTSP